MDKINIHFVHFYSRPGGIEVLLPVIIQHITGYFFSAFVIRKPLSEEPDIYNNTGIPVEYGSIRIFFACYKLWIYARKYRKEIFHVYNIGPLFLLILKLAGVTKLIYSIHGTKYWRNNQQKMIRKFLWKLALAHKFKITSNSEYSGYVFSRMINSGWDIQLLYNPIDSKKFIPLIERNDIQIPEKIIYCGRLANGKNLVKWIILAGDILKQFPGFVFEIYGEGSEKEKLLKLIREHHLENKVFLKGYIKNTEEIYQYSDLLIFLSEYESFGNVVVESILCGTPVIASKIPSMEEIFKNYPEFLIPLDENLKMNVLKKLEDYSLLKISAQNAAIEFRERFSLEQHIEKLEEIYNSFNE